MPKNDIIKKGFDNMKRIIKLLVILLLPIVICSCNNEQRPAGQLIEISAVELTNNFYGTKSKDFIFVIINEHKSGYMNFEKDLERLVKETNQTIYYTYYQHIDTESALLIFNAYDAYFTSNAYHIVENSEIILTKMYTTYDQMKKDLENKNIYEEIVYQSDKEINSNLKKAKEEYDKGNVSVSYNYINKIWDTKEAKDFYNTHPSLGIIKSWEHFVITDGSKERITYRSLLFYHNSNFFYETLIKEYNDKFEKPNSLDRYEKVYYYVKDDIIYTSDKENGTYTKRFKIKKVEKVKLYLFDYKYKKDYIYDRRV